MSAMNKVILRAFEATLNEIGFTKKSGSWYREERDSILVANLQKSDFSDAYFINLGIWLKPLGGADKRLTVTDPLSRVTTYTYNLRGVQSRGD
jgi:hypothetical protein